MSHMYVTLYMVFSIQDFNYYIYIYYIYYTEPFIPGHTLLRVEPGGEGELGQVSWCS